MRELYKTHMRIVYKGNYIRMTCGEICLVPLPKQTIATKRALITQEPVTHNAPICTIFTKKYSPPAPPCPLCGFVMLNPTPIMPRKNCYLTVCSLVLDKESKQLAQVQLNGLLK